MFYLRQADKRGRTQTDWLDSRHTFSFGKYYDPRFMGPPLWALRAPAAPPGMAGSFADVPGRAEKSPEDTAHQ